jgi:hypothetical protein
MKLGMAPISIVEKRPFRTRLREDESESMISIAPKSGKPGATNTGPPPPGQAMRSFDQAHGRENPSALFGFSNIAKAPSSLVVTLGRKDQ